MKKLLLLTIIFTGCNSAFWQNLQPRLINCAESGISSSVQEALPLIEKALGKDNYQVELDKLEGKGIDTLFCGLSSIISAGIPTGRGSVDPTSMFLAQRARDYLVTKGIK